MRSAKVNENVAFSMVRPKEGPVPPLYPLEEAEAQAEEAPSLKAGRRNWQKCSEGLWEGIKLLGKLGQRLYFWNQSGGGNEGMGKAENCPRPC